MFGFESAQTASNHSRFRTVLIVCWPFLAWLALCYFVMWLALDQLKASPYWAVIANLLATAGGSAILATSLWKRGLLRNATRGKWYFRIIFAMSVFFAIFSVGVHWMILTASR